MTSAQPNSTPRTQPVTPNPLAHYGVVELANGLIFIPGQGCRDPDTGKCVGILERNPDNSVKKYDIDVQTRGVLRNVIAELRKLGLGLEHLIDVVVMIKDGPNKDHDFAVMNTIWNEFFRDIAIPPARTTLFPANLPGDNFIEIKVQASRIAKVPPQDG